MCASTWFKLVWILKDLIFKKRRRRKATATEPNKQGSNLLWSVSKLLRNDYRTAAGIVQEQWCHFSFCLINLTTICGNLCTHLHEQIQWEQHLLMALLYISSCLITNKLCEMLCFHLILVEISFMHTEKQMDTWHISYAFICNTCCKKQKSTQNYGSHKHPHNCYSFLTTSVTAKWIKVAMECK